MRWIIACVLIVCGFSICSANINDFVKKVSKVGEDVLKGNEFDAAKDGINAIKSACDAALCKSNFFFEGYCCDKMITEDRCCVRVRWYTIAGGIALGIAFLLIVTCCCCCCCGACCQRNRAPDRITLVSAGPPMTSVVTTSNTVQSVAPRAAPPNTVFGQAVH